MDNETFSARLHTAILRELGITEPPYRLTIEVDVGSGAATLRDKRKGTDALGQGVFVSACFLHDLRDDRLGDVAKEVAESMRADLEAKR